MRSDGSLTDSDVNTYGLNALGDPISYTSSTSSHLG